MPSAAVTLEGIEKLKSGPSALSDHDPSGLLHHDASAILVAKTLLRSEKTPAASSGRAKHLAALILGAVGAQGILVAASPILTRLYDPAAFGMLAAFTAILSLVAVAANLRYEIAIPVVEDEQEASDLTWLAAASAVAVSLLVLVGVAIFRGEIATMLASPAMATWLWLLPPTVLCLGLYQALYFSALRAGEINVISATKVVRAFVTAIAQIGAYALGGAGLIVGQAIGHGAGIGTIARRIKHVRRAPSYATMRKRASDHRSYPIWSVWSGLFNSAGSQAAPLLFAALFSLTEAGLFALTHRVLSVPAMFVGQAVADMVLRDAGAARRGGTLPLLVSKSIRTLAMAAAIPALLVIAFGPQLFELVFGAAWREAGEIARWMMPWVFLVFITSPFTRLFAVLGKNHIATTLDAMMLAARMGAIVVGHATLDNFGQTVQLFAVVSAVCWLAYLLVMLRLVRNDVV